MLFQLKPLKIEDFGKLAGRKKCAHVGITGKVSLFSDIILNITFTRIRFKILTQESALLDLNLKKTICLFQKLY